MEAISVLDFGMVRLIDSMGSDLSIVRAARASYDADWRAGIDKGSDDRLIRYLWRNYHTSPFEAVTMTFEVMAPIFVIRQWLRHRTQSPNELSARYRELPRMYFLPEPETVGVQSTNNKQGRDTTNRELVEIRASEIERVHLHCEAAFDLYDDLISSNWPKELARMHLPLNVYSHMFTTMNLLNLMKFLTLRTHEHAQYEIRVYAEAMRELARTVAPVAISAWEGK